MRNFIYVIFLVVGHALVGGGPSGSYCGSPHTPIGDGTIKITSRPSSKFDIDASWTPKGGQKKSGSETGLEYTYTASTGDITVKSVDKLQDLLNKIKAPLSADQLSHLQLKADGLYVTKLKYTLKSCQCNI